jgi:hypothetical protein
MHRSNFAAWALIVIGVFLLLNQFDFPWFTRENVIIGGSLLLGGLLLWKGVTHPRRKGLLGGVFFSMLGLMLLFMKVEFLPIDDFLGIGIIMVSLAAGNLVYYLATRIKISNLIFAVLYLFLGAPFLMAHYDYWPDWEMMEFFRNFWPVTLIVFGAILLVDSIIKRAKDKTI